MAKNTAECGKRDERALVKDLESRGYKARRQPGSGNIDPSLPHDVEWTDSPIGRLVIECKWRTECGWRTLLRWMEGAPILTLKCNAVRSQDSERYVFMRWSTFMAIVGDAADRSEIAADLPSVEPDKPWSIEPRHMVDEIERAHASHAAEATRRARIQAAHKNPPQRELKPNKMKGRGFGK